MSLAISTSSNPSPSNYRLHSQPSVSNWTNLPEELMSQFATLAFFKDSKQAGAMNLVCRAWRAFILNNITDLRPQNLHELCSFGPRFSNIRTLIITEKACDETNQFYLYSSARNSSTKHHVDQIISCHSRLSLNLAHFAIFKDLVHLNVENNRYIDDKSFQALRCLPSLRSVNAAKCRQLIDLCDLQGYQLRFLKLSGCNGISNLALQRIAQCSHLQSLNLASSAAEQTCFSTLSSLRKLTNLDLSRNFPPSSVNVTALSVLSDLAILKLNNISGFSSKCDNFFSSMTKLSSLGLKNSCFHRKDLQALTCLLNLSDLDLSSTSFVFGPKLSELRSLQKLTKITLNSSQVVSLEELTALTQLRHMRMKSAVVLECTSFKSLSQLRSLELLDLSGNNVQTACLGAILSLGKLTSLKIGRNSKQRYGKKGLNLPSLQHLNLRNWRVNKELITGLLKLTQLTHLNLSKSNLKNRDICCFLHLTRLVHLNLNSCFSLTADGLVKLIACKELKHLYLSKSGACGVKMAFLTHLQNLETLDLSFCFRIKNGIFQIIAQLSKLRVLSLRSTSVTLLQSQTFVNLRHLRAIDIGSCQLSNSDLLQMVGIKELKHLDCSNTFISLSAIAEFKQCLPNTKLTLMPVVRR